MVNEIMLDVENVFRWQKSDDERVPSQGRLDYIRDRLSALIWWTDEHMVPPAEVLPARVDALRGYGKLDPSGEAFTQVLLTWSPWIKPEANYLRQDESSDRFTAKIDRAQKFPRNSIIVSTITAPGVKGTFTLVNFGKDVAETVLLDDARTTLASRPGANRVVLCSRDRRVVSEWQQRASDDHTVLLAYNTPKAPQHIGDARVTTLSELAGVYKNLNQSGLYLAPGTEITRAILDDLREKAKTVRPRRHRTPEEGSATRQSDAPSQRMAKDPISLLRAIRWDALTAGPPTAKSWRIAWGNDDLHRTVAAVVAEELKRIQATNDELAQYVDGLLHGEADDALMAYRALALLALHRLSEDKGKSLGVAIRSDPELTEQFWRAYVLMQPYLGIDDHDDAQPAPQRRKRKASAKTYVESEDGPN